MKELQSSVTESGVKVHQSTTSRAFHKTGLHVRVARKQPSLKKNLIKAHLEFAIEDESDPAKMWDKALWSDKTKIAFSGQLSNHYSMCGTNLTLPVPQQTPSPK